jgi:uncharacterized protein (TIGR02147 family)
VQQHQYRGFLQDEFALRQTRNPKYSLRAFAQHLGLSPAYTSQILKGQRSLGVGLADTLARRLKWETAKAKCFRLLVELAHAENTERKSEIELEIAKLAPRNYSVLSLDNFRIISDWFHAAILEVLRLPGISKNAASLSRRLSVPLIHIELALDRLKRLGIVRSTEGEWEKTQGPLQIESVPSAAIRHFHCEMLAKAATAIDKQEPGSRHLTSLTIAISRSKLPALRARIDEFRKELVEMADGEEVDSVYQFSAQLFRLDKDQEEK